MTPETIKQSAENLGATCFAICATSSRLSCSLTWPLACKAIPRTLVSWRCSKQLERSSTHAKG